MFANQEKRTKSHVLKAVLCGRANIFVLCPKYLSISWLTCLNLEEAEGDKALASSKSPNAALGHLRSGKPSSEMTICTRCDASRYASAARLADLYERHCPLTLA